MHNRYHVFHGAYGLAGDFCHGIGHVLLAGKTKIWWNIRIVDNFFCVCFTPWEAAATSLGPGQGMEDFLHLGVRFNVKLVSRQGQADTKE